MQLITSEQNPSFKRAVRLHESRGRRQQGRIIIFGTEEVARAHQCNIEFLELFFCEESASPAAKRLIPKIASNPSTRIYCLPQQLFRKIAYGDRTDSLVAVTNRPATELADFHPRTDALILVLESIEKPGNVGAIYRSADAAGIDAIFLADSISDVFHPNAIRSSLGSVFSIPTVSASSTEIIEYLTSNDFEIVTTRVEADMNYFEFDLRKRCAISLGNEKHGLSGAWNGAGITAVTIPMRGKSDSLNVAMSATILAFEARRQRLSTETRQVDC